MWLFCCAKLLLRRPTIAPKISDQRLARRALREFATASHTLGAMPELPASRRRRTPYLDALRAYAERDPGRFHVPGHKGGDAADPTMREAFGARALRMDIPALTQGIDAGPAPTPFQQAQELAAEAWGARRTWFLINGASQGNHAACLTLAQGGERVVVQRNVHSSTVEHPQDHRKLHAVGDAASGSRLGRAHGRARC